jgi:ketopantoate reductase
MTPDKTNVLLVGSGGIGTIAALNLQAGGQASVTCVLRSNFEAVNKHGFKIESVDHGYIESFRPAKGSILKEIKSFPCFVSSPLFWQYKLIQFS